MLKLKTDELESLLAKFNREVRNARDMIVAEPGMSETNSLFRSITKAKHESPLIEYLRNKQK